MGKVVGTLKKSLWILLMIVPPLTMLLRELPFFEPLESAAEYTTFLLSSAASALVLSLAAVWKQRHDPRSNLSEFLKAYVLNLIKGEVHTGSSVVFFVVMAAVLTAWLPDSFAEGRVMLAAGSVFYLAALVFGLYWVHESPVEVRDLVPTRYLVMALSWMSQWSAEHLWNMDCSKVIRNGEKLNVVPVAVAITYHLEKLERVYLLNSAQNEGSPLFRPQQNDERAKEEKEKEIEFLGNPPEELKDVFEGLNDFQKKLVVFFAKLSKCLAERGHGVRFRLYWENVWGEPSGKPTEVGTGERIIEVVLLRNVPYGDIERAREIISLATRNVKGDEWPLITYDLTTGTATLSVALALEAVKEHAQAQYLMQGLANKEPHELLRRVDVDPLSLLDIEDVIKRRLEAS